MALEAHVRPPRQFRRVDGTLIDLPGTRRPLRSQIRTHRSDQVSELGRRILQFGAFVRRTQRRFDFALAVVCAMLVGGAVFFVLGLINFGLGLDPVRGWLFWVIGFSDWFVALGIFFSFMNGPLPRHRTTR